VHALLPGGLRQLERWFPGFTEQALAAGGRRVQGSMRLVYVDGAGAVNGVRYGAGGGPGSQHADFTVDAMGRSSRLSQWLAAAGWQRPPLQRMKVEINYATALFRREKGDPDVGIVRWQSRAPSDGLRGAVLIQVEDDRWQVTMSGYVDSRPGANAEDFIRLAKSALPPEFAAVAERGRIVGEIKTYRHAESVRRDFHALTRFPARLVATGDAVASFNPVYAQGISSAALQASALSAYLRSDPDLSEPARGFFALQKVVVDAAWDTSTTADLALPHINGPYPRGYRLRQRISKRVHAAALLDPEIARRVDEVGFMLRHPGSLRSPGTLARVALAGLRTNHGGDIFTA
jgi:2-polyprenyl-6-methoxyphenol hydroxylase-like FAD-dependent oxidoreductase